MSGDGFGRAARRPLPRRRPGGMGGARRALLALRLRDLDAGVPVPGARRRGHLSGGLCEGLRAARFAPQRRGDPALDRPAHPACLCRSPASGLTGGDNRRGRAGRRPGRGRDRPDRRGARRPRRDGGPARELPRDPRPLFARDETYRTIGEALELPAGTIASRISRCLVKLRDELEGRKPVPAQSGGQVSV